VKSLRVDIIAFIPEEKPAPIDTITTVPVMHKRSRHPLSFAAVSATSPALAAGIVLIWTVLGSGMGGFTQDLFRPGDLSLTGRLLGAHWMPPAEVIVPARLTLKHKNLFPAAGARNICSDTPLRITFTRPPALGDYGKIQVFDTDDKHLVEAIDVSARTVTKSIGGLDNFKYYPIIVSGNEVSIFLRNGALTYNKTYFITIDAGVFQSGEDNYAGIRDPKTWRFTTKAAAPAAGSTRLTVAADGTGDFCTVQGALDFIPEGNTAPRTVFLRKGTYTEVVFFTNKHAITLLGEDRRQSIITYANNANFNNGGGNPFAGNAPNPSAEPRAGGSIYRRGIFLAHRADDLVIANLTFRNTTPQGGSQAETIILNGTPTARAILKDLDLYSYQDTLQINGQAYISNCHIEGDVDFMWGTGPCFFENCVCRALRSGAYYTQIRNPRTNHGYVYLHCTFNGAAGIKDNYLSRIEPGRFPYSELVLLDCALSETVGLVAWQFQGVSGLPEVLAPNVHFWEFNSHTADGHPVDVSLRLAGSHRLVQPDDAATIANYSSPAFVLGGAWDPKLAPVFAKESAAAAGKIAGRNNRSSKVVTQNVKKVS
jgi:pectin methylesterase-like acyl-CoA thioesterase